MFHYEEDPREELARKLAKFRTVYKVKYAGKLSLTTNMLVNHKIVVIRVTGMGSASAAPGVFSACDDLWLGVYNHPIQQAIYINDSTADDSAFETLSQLREDVLHDFGVDITDVKNSKDKRSVASLLLHIFL